MKINISSASIVGKRVYRIHTGQVLPRIVHGKIVRDFGEYFVVTGPIGNGAGLVPKNKVAFSIYRAWANYIEELERNQYAAMQEVERVQRKIDECRVVMKKRRVKSRESIPR